MIAVDGIEAKLGELADPVRAVQEKRYLKSDLRHLGIRVPVLREIAVTAATGLHREELLALAEELWDSPLHERRVIAIEVLTRGVPRLTADDLPVAERLIRASRTWAYVDPLAIKVSGNWSSDTRRWERRWTGGRPTRTGGSAAARSWRCCRASAPAPRTCPA
jgi:3-methyladenine DNA glycosylase AlkD